MKVKCGIIYNAFQTVMEFSEKTMPVKLTGKFLRLSNDLNKELEFIDKQRQMIIDKYGKKDENGQLIIENDMVSFENNEIAQKAQEELNELSNMEVEITDRHITEEELEAAGIELNMNQFAALENFLEHND